MVANTKKRKLVNKVNRQSHNKGDLIFYIALLAFPLLQLAIFYFGVNFQSILLSFQQFKNGKFIWDSTFDNFHHFFGGGSYEEGLIQTKGFWTMIKNSVLVYIFTSLAGTVLATFFSYYIYKKRTMSTFFKICLFLPTILPIILLVIIFKFFTGDGIPAFIAYLFPNAPEVTNVWLHGGTDRFVIITAFTVWVSFGGQVLVYTGAMDQIPNEVIEAGQIDGASTFREFISIIVPYILPTVTTFLIAGLAGIFTAQNNLFSFTAGGADPVEQTVGYYIYMLVYSPDGDKSGYPFASFMGLIFTILVMPLILGLRKLTNKVTK